MKALKAAASFAVAVSLLANLITVTAKADSAVTFSVFVYSYTQNEYMLKQTEMTYNEQVSPIQVISELYGADAEISGGYLKSAFGLAERAHGAESGWIYMINGIAPPISAAQYKMRPGDRLDWIYITDEEQYNIYPPGTAASSQTSSNSGNNSAAEAVSPSPSSAVSTPPSEPMTSSVYTDSGSASYRPSYSSSHAEGYSSVPSAQNVSSNSGGNNEDGAASQGQDVSYQPSSGTGEKSYAEKIESAVNKSVRFLNNNPGTWSAAALFSAGAEINSGVADVSENEYNSLKDSDDVTGKIRALLNYAASGGSGNYKAVAEDILNSEIIDKTGANGPVFALILLCETDVEGVRWSRTALSDLIEEYQHENGGFSLAKGMEPDADITAMAVTALSMAGLKKESAEKGIEYLSSIQNGDGSMSSMGVSNCESTAQTIIALISSGGLVNDESFIKNGNSLLDALLQFECSDGFSHVKGSETDVIATEQALMALSAVKSGITPYSGIFDNISDSDDISDTAVAAAVIAIMLTVLAAAGLICYKTVLSEDKTGKS